MKKITFIVTAMLFAASVTVLGQTQKPAEKKDPQKTTTTTTTTVKQDPAKPAATMKTQETVKPATTVKTQETAKPASSMTSQEAVKKDQKTRIVIPATELPKTAQDYIVKMHPGKKIEQAIKITDEKGLITYKADVAGMIMHFDATGKFTKETKKEEKSSTGAKPATTPKTEQAPAPKTQPAPVPEKKKETTEPVKK